MIDTSALACCYTRMREDYLSALRTEPLLSFPDWAAREVRNRDGSKFQFLPYQVGPAHDLFDPRFEYVALRWFSGAGKTYLTSIAYAYGITQLKLRFGKIYPAEYQGKEWMEEDLMPVLESTRAVAEIPMRKDLALLKKWVNGGYIRATGPSQSSIRTMRIHVSDCDEIDALIQKSDSGGSLMDSMEMRTRNMPMQLHWRASFPSVEGESNIDASIDASDGLTWWFDCPRCGNPQCWHPRQIEGSSAGAVMRCEGCEKTATDAERRKSTAETGHWRNRHGERVEPGEAPEDGRRRGYHLNCMAYQQADDDAYPDYLAECAGALERAESAEDPREAKRVVVNTRWAESYAIEYEDKPEPTGLMAGREHYDPNEALPEECVQVFCGIDFNKSFQAVQFVGFGIDRVFPLDYIEIHGRCDQPSTWAEINHLLRRKWHHPLGVEIGIARTFADSRYETRRVREWVRSKAGIVIAAVGDATIGATALSQVVRDQATGCRKITLGADELKNLIYEWLDEESQARTKIVFHDGRTGDGDEIFGREYFDGLMAEEREMVRARTGVRKGMVVPHFTHPEGAPRNEPLDTLALALAAFKNDRTGLKMALAMLKKAAEKVENPPELPRRRKKTIRRTQFKR